MSISAAQQRDSVIQPRFKFASAVRKGPRQVTAPGSPSPGLTGPRWTLVPWPDPGAAAAGPPGSRGVAGPGTEKHGEETGAVPGGVATF